MVNLLHITLLLICLFAETYRLYEKLSSLYSKEVGLTTSLILILLIVYMSFFDAKYRGVRVSVIITLISILLGLFISVDPLYQMIRKSLHPIPKQYISYPEKPKEPMYQSGNRSEYSENTYLWTLHTERKRYKEKVKEWELEKIEVDKKNKAIEEQNNKPEIIIDFYEFSFKLLVSLILGIVVPFGVFYSSEKLKDGLYLDRRAKRTAIDFTNEFKGILQDTATKTAILQDTAIEIESTTKKNLDKENQILVVSLRKNGMTVKQISAYLGVSERTIYYWLTKEKRKNKA